MFSPFCTDRDSNDLVFELVTRQVRIQEEGFFTWKHFDLLIQTNATHSEEVISKSKRIQVSIIDDDNSVVSREVISYTKIYPNPDKSYTSMKIVGDLKIEQLSDEILSVRISRKLKVRNPWARMTSKYELSQGLYKVLVEYRAGDQVLQTEPTVLTVR